MKLTMSRGISISVLSRIASSVLVFLACQLAPAVGQQTGAPSAAPAQTQDFQTELEAGKSAVGRKEIVEALQHLAKANELRQQKCSECYVWMARLDLGVGRLDLASTATEKAVATAASNSELASAQLYRGVVLAREQKLAEAEAAFRSSVKADPTCVECNFNLGFVLLEESKDDEGVAILKSMLPKFAGTPRAREIERFIANPARIRKTYAPDFLATLSTGEKVTLDTFKGKVVLLDFWGTWCPPCRASLPRLKELAATLDPEKVVILSINEGDTREAWAKFIKENGMTWPQIYDTDLAMHNAFGVDGFPRYYVLNKDGIIVAQFKGWKDNGEATISEAIAKALTQ